MSKKNLDEKKFLIVAVGKNIAEAKLRAENFLKFGFTFPTDFSISAVAVSNEKNLVAELNKIQKNSDAKYKFYLNADVNFVQKNFLMNVLNNFFVSPKIGMVGLCGSELPLDGNYLSAQNFFGDYYFINETGEQKKYSGKSPLMNKSVHILESSFFATCEDILWDENIGEDFLFVSQCCRYRNAGYKIVACYQQDNSWIVFAKDNFSYKPKKNQKNYQKQLENFQKLYKNKISPLVSVLIPTYNQPKFFEEALKSALNQTYSNIEILIGDDSTNEDTKNLIQPYLKKYKNVKYFYHGEKNSRGATANFDFLMNNCKGEFINFLLHDDLFYPEKIYKMMEYFNRDLDERISLVTSSRDAIDQNGNFLKRQSKWKPVSDTVIPCEEVGRYLMFTIGNFIGELTTAMFRKRDAIVKNSSQEKIYAVGNYCGVSDRIYGDLSTFLNIFKKGGEFVFISESLSAFRHHPDQSTHKPWTKVNIPVDALDFILISWLNNLFLRDSEEFLYSCNKWLIYLQMFVKGIDDNDSEEVKNLKNKMFTLREIILTGNYEKIFDAAVRFLLERLPEDNPINNLIIKNEVTGLYQKVNEVKTLCVYQKAGG